MGAAISRLFNRQPATVEPTSEFKQTESKFNWFASLRRRKTMTETSGSPSQSTPRLQDRRQIQASVLETEKANDHSLSVDKQQLREQSPKQVRNDSITNIATGSTGLNHLDDIEHISAQNKSQQETNKIEMEAGVDETGFIIPEKAKSKLSEWKRESGEFDQQEINAMTGEKVEGQHMVQDYQTGQQESEEYELGDTEIERIAPENRGQQALANNMPLEGGMNWQNDTALDDAQAKADLQDVKSEVDFTRAAEYHHDDNAWKELDSGAQLHSKRFAPALDTNVDEAVGRHNFDKKEDHELASAVPEMLEESRAENYYDKTRAEHHQDESSGAVQRESITEFNVESGTLEKQENHEMRTDSNVDEWNYRDEVLSETAAKEVEQAFTSAMSQEVEGNWQDVHALRDAEAKVELQFDQAAVDSPVEAEYPHPEYAVKGKFSGTESQANEYPSEFGMSGDYEFQRQISEENAGHAWASASPGNMEESSAENYDNAHLKASDEFDPTQSSAVGELESNNKIQYDGATQLEEEHHETTTDFNAEDLNSRDEALSKTAANEVEQAFTSAVSQEVEGHWQDGHAVGDREDEMGLQSSDAVVDRDGDAEYPHGDYAVKREVYGAESQADQFPSAFVLSGDPEFQREISEENTRQAWASASPGNMEESSAVNYENAHIKASDEFDQTQSSAVGELEFNNEIRHVDATQLEEEHHETTTDFNAEDLNSRDEALSKTAANEVEQAFTSAVSQEVEEHWQDGHAVGDREDEMGLQSSDAVVDRDGDAEYPHGDYAVKGEVYGAESQADQFPSAFVLSGDHDLQREISEENAGHAWSSAAPINMEESSAENYDDTQVKESNKFDPTQSSAVGDLETNIEMQQDDATRLEEEHNVMTMDSNVDDWNSRDEVLSKIAAQEVEQAFTSAMSQEVEGHSRGDHTAYDAEDKIEFQVGEAEVKQNAEAEYPNTDYAVERKVSGAEMQWGEVPSAYAGYDWASAAPGNFEETSGENYENSDVKTSDEFNPTQSSIAGQVESNNEFGYNDAMRHVEEHHETTTNSNLDEWNSRDEALSKTAANEVKQAFESALSHDVEGHYQDGRTYGDDEGDIEIQVGEAEVNRNAEVEYPLADYAVKEKVYGADQHAGKFPSAFVMSSDHDFQREIGEENVGDVWASAAPRNIEESSAENYDNAQVKASDEFDLTESSTVGELESINEILHDDATRHEEEHNKMNTDSDVNEWNSKEDALLKTAANEVEQAFTSAMSQNSDRHWQDGHTYGDAESDIQFQVGEAEVNQNYETEYPNADYAVKGKVSGAETQSGESPSAYLMKGDHDFQREISKENSGYDWASAAPGNVEELSAQNFDNAHLKMSDEFDQTQSNAVVEGYRGHDLSSDFTSTNFKNYSVVPDNTNEYDHDDFVDEELENSIKAAEQSVRSAFESAITSKAVSNDQLPESSHLSHMYRQSETIPTQPYVDSGEFVVNGSHHDVLPHDSFAIESNSNSNVVDNMSFINGELSSRGLVEGKPTAVVRDSEESTL